jgi:hypothetical protein
MIAGARAALYYGLAVGSSEFDDDAQATRFSGLRDTDHLRACLVAERRRHPLNRYV